MKKLNPYFLIALTLVLTFLFGTSVSNVNAYSYYVTIQPIQVGDGSGNWANSALQLFTAETQKIWNQADIQVNYLPWNTFSSAVYYNLSASTEFNNLWGTPGHGQSSNPNAINVWFVHQITNGGGTIFGLTSIPSPNMEAISDVVFTLNRLDTLAHELGHSLGISGDYNDPPNNYLMSAGSYRLIPSSINDIHPPGPGGLDTDHLKSSEIATAQSSPFVVGVVQGPEPCTIILIGFGIISFACLRKRFEV